MAVGRLLTVLTWSVLLSVISVTAWGMDVIAAGTGRSPAVDIQLRIGRRLASRQAVIFTAPRLVTLVGAEAQYKMVWLDSDGDRHNWSVSMQPLAETVHGMVAKLKLDGQDQKINRMVMLKDGEQIIAAGDIDGKPVELGFRKVAHGPPPRTPPAGAAPSTPVAPPADPAAGPAPVLAPVPGIKKF